MVCGFAPKTRLSRVLTKLSPQSISDFTVLRLFGAMGSRTLSPVVKTYGACRATGSYHVSHVAVWRYRC
jgi:hypothetical protein